MLTLDNTGISDEGVEHLKEVKNLHDLKLNNVQVTDAGLAQLARNKNLESIDIRGTKVTDVGVELFRAERPEVDVTR